MLTEILPSQDIRSVLKEKYETSAAKRAILRGTFTPSKNGYNRKQRFALAHKAVVEGKAELLDAGCNLVEARREAVNPTRKSVARQLREVWRNRKTLRELARKKKGG